MLVIAAYLAVFSLSVYPIAVPTFPPLVVIASANFHRLPVTCANSQYACISYYGLQALQLWGQEGLPFPDDDMYFVFA